MMNLPVSCVASLHQKRATVETRYTVQPTAFKQLLLSEPGSRFSLTAPAQSNYTVCAAKYI